jgi:hypothetical protein
MRRVALFPVMVACLLAAGCAGKSPDAGGVVGAPPTSPTGVPSATQVTTTPSKPASTHTTQASSDWPSPGDCVSYNPNNLKLAGSAAGGTFTVSDGPTVVERLHGQVDQVGDQALALARRYRTHCYLGRNNNRDEKGDYIFDYWRDPSGQSPAIPGLDEACSSYNNKNLTVEDMGGTDGWRVKDHDHVLHLFDNGTDAQNGDKVLLKYSQICTIGDALDSDHNLGQVTFGL